MTHLDAGQVACLDLNGFAVTDWKQDLCVVEQLGAVLQKVTLNSMRHVKVTSEK